MTGAPDAQAIVRTLLRNRRSLSADELVRTLDELIDRYQDFAPDEAPARAIRRGFLLMLKNTPQILAEERILRFLAEQIEPEDFADFPWHTPDAIIAYCELLYSFHFVSDTMAQHAHMLEQHLLRYALQQYEERGAYEQMFQLLRLAPASPALTDIELKRLRNRIYLYEVRRVRRARFWLYGYLVVQVVLMIVVFPLLFINAENGSLGRLVESESTIELPPEATRSFTYRDGLYWSLITAASIGYGDITPQTAIGKALAAALGIMGVITIGVIAGLILNWLAPRDLD